jgi:TrmH family RNA methyltransferase
MQHAELVHQFASAGVPTSVAAAKQIELLAVTEHTAGILAVVARPAWPNEKMWEQLAGEDFLGMLCVGLQVPGNVGTLLRTLTAAGGSAAFLSEGCAELSSPKTLRSSAGAVFKLPVAEHIHPMELLERCTSLGVQTLAAAAKGGRPYTTYDMTRPTLLVMGGEGRGLDPNVISACSQVIQIPMPGGMESLNVGAAGAIMFYEAVRQRRMMVANKLGLKRRTNG